MVDVLIIGGGPAGYTAAARAAQLGMQVVLFEQSALGGVCLNEGCVPTKSFLYSAKMLDNATKSERYGLACDGARLAHDKVVARKDSIVKQLCGGIAMSLKTPNIEIVKGSAALLCADGATAVVECEGEKYIGKNVIVATGSAPAIPKIDGIEAAIASGHVMTSREALSNLDLPKSLAIVGAGVIGLEMASYFYSVGCDVSIIEMTGAVGGTLDGDIAVLLKRSFDKRGVKIHLNSKVTRILDEGISCQDKDGNNFSINADKILLATGRVPRVDAIKETNAVSQSCLALDKATADVQDEDFFRACEGAAKIGIQNGAICVDERCRTNIKNVYAAGDANGRMMLAHVAYRQADVCINNIAGIDDVMDYGAIASIIYTNPEVASVGETELSAMQKQINATTIKIKNGYSGRYVAENTGGDGITKIVIDNTSKTTIGMSMIGNHSAEIAACAAVLISSKMQVNDIKKIVFPHPTVGELIRDAVNMYDA